MHDMRDFHRCFFRWETKGRFRKRVVLPNVPSFRFSFRGNMRTYPRSFFVPGEHPNVPSFRFLLRGNIRQNHPFGKPPFCQPPLFGCSDGVHLRRPDRSGSQIQPASNLKSQRFNSLRFLLRFLPLFARICSRFYAVVLQFQIVAIRIRCGSDSRFGHLSSRRSSDSERAKGAAKASCGETVVQNGVFGESVSSLPP